MAHWHKPAIRNQGHRHFQAYQMRVDPINFSPAGKQLRADCVKRVPCQYLIQLNIGEFLGEWLPSKNELSLPQGNFLKPHA